MIKNIILDIGGVIADDGAKKYQNERYRYKLNLPFEEIRHIGKIAFGSTFNKCLLGNETIKNHISNVVNDNPKYKDELIYMLDPKLYNETYPIIDETLKYIYTLKDKGYKIYFLSNITLESYEYMKHILDDFNGGVYSYQEHLIKPNKEIYKRIIDKYNLVKEECVFFDDKFKNVQAANEFGLKSFVFKNISDIEEVLKDN